MEGAFFFLINRNHLPGEETVFDKKRLPKIYRRVCCNGYVCMYISGHAVSIDRSKRRSFFIFAFSLSFPSFFFSLS